MVGAAGLCWVGAEGVSLGQAVVGDSVPMTRVVVPVEPVQPGATEAAGAGQQKEAETKKVVVAEAPPKATVEVAEAASVGAVPTSQPVAPPVVANEIRRFRAEPVEGEAAPAGEGTRLGGAAWETLRVILGLGAVLGLIIGMKMGAGKILGIRGAGANANRGVRVLSRTMMGPRQQLVLLQVGRKLVLVSDSGGQVSTVTEVTDPDEVAELAAQALGEGGVVGGFGGVGFRTAFTRQSRVVQAVGGGGVGAAGWNERNLRLESEEDEDEFESLPEVRVNSNGAEPPADEPDLSGLAERVRLLGRQFSATR